MAAFWQWRVAEEIQFPPDCISFDEDDLPGSTLHDMVTPQDMSPLGSENDKSSQKPPDQDRHTANSPENDTPGRRAHVGQCTSPSISKSEEVVSPLKLDRTTRAQSAEQSGDSNPQQKDTGFERGTPTGILEVNGICDEDSDSDNQMRISSNSCSTDAHKTCRQNGDVVQGASTSKQQKSLNFVGEAAKGRPAYKYLPLVALKVHQKAASKQEEFVDAQSSDSGSNEVKKSGESQSSTHSEKLLEAGSISESLSVVKSELILQNGVKMGLVSKSEIGSASLEGWRLDPMQEAIGAPGAHRKGENGDVSAEKARANRQGSVESDSESVLSPFREESTPTAILTQSDWTGTSTLVTDSLCAEAATPGEVLSGPEDRESTPVAFSPRKETTGSSCKANGEGIFPSGRASTSEASREEGRGSASRASSQLSALEEYLARSEETEEVPESLSAFEAAAAMREAVRRMREDAALLALRLSALYASDASNLRMVAQSMMQHVAGMQHEMKEMRTGLVAIKSTRRSFTSLLTDGLLSALVFAVMSELPRLRESVLRWLGSTGTPLSWFHKRKLDLTCSLELTLPQRRWPLRWRLLIALGFLGSKCFVTSMCQDRAKRASATTLLSQWNQIAERLVIMNAIGERGLARVENDEGLSPVPSLPVLMK